MIYGFARQSGGQVRIYSEVGQGTTVCLYLPRHHGAAERADERRRRGDAPRPRRGRDGAGRRRRADGAHAGDRGAGGARLRAPSRRRTAPAGLKVLQSSARIDLLVTDVGLPGGMNGRQVADAGARRCGPDLKVLFITGYAENAVLGNGHLEPGMQVLTKPFAMDALAAKIQEMTA